MFLLVVMHKYRGLVKNRFASSMINFSVCSTLHLIDIGIGIGMYGAIKGSP
jgi:hypothetical protein